MGAYFFKLLRELISIFAVCGFYGKYVPIFTTVLVAQN